MVTGQHRPRYRHRPALLLHTCSAVLWYAWVVLVAILGGTFLLYALLWYWVGLYYESMFYGLREDEIAWKRGVWFRTGPGIVRITVSPILTSGRDRSCGF